MELKFCRDGWGCVHFEINKLCKELKDDGEKLELDSYRLNVEKLEEFEEKLGDLKNFVKELYDLVVPAIESGIGREELSCRDPDAISWGRYVYDSSKKKLEEAWQNFAKEKARRELRAKKQEAELKKKKSSLKKKTVKKILKARKFKINRALKFIFLSLLSYSM